MMWAFIPWSSGVCQACPCDSHCGRRDALKWCLSVLILISDDPCLQAPQGGPRAVSLIPSLTLILPVDISLLTHWLIYVRRVPRILTVQWVITSCDPCLFWCSDLAHRCSIALAPVLVLTCSQHLWHCLTFWDRMSGLSCISPVQVGTSRVSAGPGSFQWRAVLNQDLSHVCPLALDCPVPKPSVGRTRKYASTHISISSPIYTHISISFPMYTHQHQLPCLHTSASASFRRVKSHGSLLI